jgi:type VI secretion system secreted protein Hcp
MPIDVFAVFQAARGSGAPAITLGETDADPRSKGIPLNSFSMGFHNKTTIGSSTGGAGAGKAEFEAVEITRYTDAASPLLHRALFTGAHYEQVTIEFFPPSGISKSPKPLYVIACKLVFITDIAQSYSGGDDGVMEQISLKFGAVEMKITPLTKTGALGKEVSTAWSQVLNAPKFEVDSSTTA